MQQIRLNNLRLLAKLQDSKFQIPSFKKDDKIAQFAILYSNRDDKAKYTVCHIVNELDWPIMVQWEIYTKVKVINLDNNLILLETNKQFNKQF
jgi:hypothetical protein